MALRISYPPQPEPNMTSRCLLRGADEVNVRAAVTDDFAWRGCTRPHTTLKRALNMV
jgi:hypothetical protein